MTIDELRLLDVLQDRIINLKLHIANGNPALKKPLLLLLILSRLEHSHSPTNEFPYAALEEPLASLIERFGGRPVTHGPKPEQPYYHLDQTLWAVHNLPADLQVSRSRTPSAKQCRTTWASLPEDFFRLLASSTEARHRLADVILDNWWPDTLHDDIRARLGLEASRRELFAARATRSRDFVEAVLTNYDHRCALCGFNARFRGSGFGVDAAHIRWHAHRGPDRLENGVALCKLHHWGLDSGVLTIRMDHTIQISPQLSTHDVHSRRLFTELQGSRLLSPRSRPPHHDFLNWHHVFVFRGDIFSSSAAP